MILSTSVEYNIVKEIKKDLRTRDNYTESDDAFLYFYVNLLRLDPNWGISKDVLQIRKDLQAFFEHVLDQLSQCNNPEIIACKVQFYFENNFNLVENLPEINRQELMKKIRSLRLLILENSNDSPKLISNIVTYIILASGLGNPMKRKVSQETEKALRSIWGEIDQLIFLNQKFSIRSEILDSLVKVTSGIRLYNKNCKKGGHGIHLLPQLLFKALKSVRHHIRHMLCKTTYRMHQILIALESCYAPVIGKYGVLLVCRVRENYLLSKLEYYKDVHICVHVFAEYLIKLLEAVVKVQSTSETIWKKYTETLDHLHQIVIPDMHMSCDHIFPIFTNLYGYWMQFQDQTVLLGGINAIFQQIRTTISATYFDNEHLKLLTYKDLPPINALNLVKDVDPNIKIFNRTDPAVVGLRTFEFNKFCCWKLVCTNGLLVKGSDDYNFVLYKRRLYKFSCAAGLESFIREPEFYINSVYQLARRKPQLTQLLRINEILRGLQNIKTLKAERHQTTITKSVEVQTEIHPIPSLIDMNYESNIWMTNKRILKMANLTHCVTRQSETQKETQIASSQVFEPKNSSTQTKVSKYVNTAYSINYIYGLRGRRDDKHMVFSMSLPELNDT